MRRGAGERSVVDCEQDLPTPGDYDDVAYWNPVSGTSSVINIPSPTWPHTCSRTSIGYEARGWVVGLAHWLR